MSCQPSTLPFTYLGLPIGANMNKARNWEPIIKKFHNKLSSWKATNLSYGGRLTLIKSVLGALGVYFLSLLKLLKCGGLGIGSLRACNLAMLTKWWWRFLHESNTLWKNVIISIHGQKGGLFSRILPTVSKRHWNAINTLQKPLSVININLQSIFVKRIGDGMSTLFWKDVGIGETPLFDRLVTTKIVEFLIDAVWPFTRNWAWRRNVRNGPEQSQLNDLLDLLKDFSPVPSPDLWTYCVDNTKSFTVSSMRLCLSV
ncbi:hypothetical protein Tco_1397910, partial [Tanacetum coccineum]